MENKNWITILRSTSFIGRAFHNLLVTATNLEIYLVRSRLHFFFTFSFYVFPVPKFFLQSLRSIWVETWSRLVNILTGNWIFQLNWLLFFPLCFGVYTIWTKKNYFHFPIVFSPEFLNLLAFTIFNRWS